MVFNFKKKQFRRFLILLIATVFCVGYKVAPGARGWDLDSSSSSGRKVFITLTASGKTLKNNLPSSDPLVNSGDQLTEAQLLQSIINDYNNIQRSYLILALDSDSDFAANSLNRRIEISYGNAAGQSSGEAKLTYLSGRISGCKISITDKGYTDAKTYIGLLTHELGHCVGLEHPQETVWSVMSYFYHADVYRLAIDDKMGIVHIYPKESADSDEKNTLGLSCAQK